MGLWDDVASVGATLVGGLIGGSSGSNANAASAKTTTAPWKVQQPYLLGGFSDASQAYNSLKTQPFYQGDLYAGMSPLQNQAIAGTQNFATGAGAETASNMLGASNASLNGAGGQMMAGGALMGFNPGNATMGNIADAGMYADNPYMSGMIDAASRDVTRNLTEDVLPGINRLGSATGNTNSSRTGVAEGIALRGAQDRLGDISAGMRGDAYQQGLSLAENARGANMNARLNSLTNAGNIYGNAFGQGLQGTAAGLTAGYNNLDALSKAGALQQQDQQGQMNADYAKWQGGDQRAFDLLDRYMQAVGGSYGSTKTSTADNGQPTWMNTLQGAVGGASAGLGLYGQYKDIFSK